jgi:hypothetical protein
MTEKVLPYRKLTDEEIFGMLGSDDDDTRRRGAELLLGHPIGPEDPKYMQYLIPATLDPAERAVSLLVEEHSETVVKLQ